MMELYIHAVSWICLPYTGIWGCGTNVQVSEKRGDCHREKQEADGSPPIGTVVDGLVGVGERTLFVTGWTRGLPARGHGRDID
jgi:hypothetical protein